MKDMLEFTREQVTGARIDEVRQTKVEPSDDEVVVGGKLVDKEKALKDGERSNSAKRSKWAVDEPTDDDVTKYADKSEWTNNMKAVRSRIRGNIDFFILGHAGWGKTQIIKSVAKKFGKTIITVYLDKAVPEDLEGIPVPMEGEKKGTVYQERALPAWASYMLDHPEKDFLLFFDEMNQADPQVMNALMPIILEKTIGGYQFDNFMVGAAGNYKDENDATHEMSSPLMERLAPVIKWEDKDSKTWKEYFDWIRKQWEPKLGKELVDEFDKNKELFHSPRVIDQKVFRFLYNIKQQGPDEWDYYEPEDYLKYLEGKGILEDDYDKERSSVEDIKKLAEYIDEWMRDSGKADQKKNDRSRSSLDSPDWFKNDIAQGMEKGFIRDSERVAWAFARENAYDLFLDEETGDAANAEAGEDLITAEQLEQEIKMNERKGIKFKYETVKDALKDNPSLKVEPKLRKKYGV